MVKTRYIQPSSALVRTLSTPHILSSEVLLLGESHQTRQKRAPGQITILVPNPELRPMHVLVYSQQQTWIELAVICPDDWHCAA